MKLICPPKQPLSTLNTLALLLVGITFSGLRASAQTLTSSVVSTPMVHGECLLPEKLEDRFWLISTRQITSSVCYADLQSPALSISRLSPCGQRSEASLAEYLETIAMSRNVVVYVHGNRMAACDAIARGLRVHSRIRTYQCEGGRDWVIWSWPSAQEGILASDARRKAQRCDAQSLYLGWLLRHHAEQDVSTSLIGYSFGGRVLTGALHAAAGGHLGGRQLDGDPVVGMEVKVGLVAPALESHWLACRGYHRLATQNIDQLSLLYNHRDAVLKRYWLLSQVRGESALGYTGPTSFAPRADGTRLPVFARDCAPIVGLHHNELDYYNAPCSAARVMASLLNDSNATR